MEVTEDKDFYAHDLKGTQGHLVHSKKCSVFFPYVKHALNVLYKMYIKHMDRTPYV